MKRNLTTIEKSQNEIRNNSGQLLGKLIKWTVLIILALLFLVIILYTAGSLRKNSPDSLLVLVRSGLVLSLLLIISSVYGLVFDIYYAISKRKPVYIAGIAGYGFLAALGSVFALGAAFIIGAVGGNLG